MFWEAEVKCLPRYIINNNENHCKYSLGLQAVVIGLKHFFSELCTLAIHSKGTRVCSKLCSLSDFFSSKCIIYKVDAAIDVFKMWHGSDILNDSNKSKLDSGGN
jgi:hypothetical protein